MCFYTPFGSKEMWDWHTTNNRLVGDDESHLLFFVEVKIALYIKDNKE